MSFSQADAVCFSLRVYFVCIQCAATPIFLGHLKETSSLPGFRIPSPTSFAFILTSSADRRLIPGAFGEARRPPDDPTLPESEPTPLPPSVALETPLRRALDAECSSEAVAASAVSAYRSQGSVEMVDVT